MATKVALINMKGGVGKSTLSVNLAWHFSAMRAWRKSVLVVDLDPQFNCSQYMLGARRYQELFVKKQGPTIWDIFEQATRTPGMRATGRKLEDCIINVANFSSGQRLDVIASQLELSYTLKNPSQKEHLLANFIMDVEDQYDVILVDCAPTESVLTAAAYLTCDKILVPVKPDFLSSIGLPLIRQSIREFTRLYKKKLELLGVCFNATSGYAPEEVTAKQEVRSLAKRFSWHVFDEEIPLSRSFPKGAREGAPIFRTSYAHTAVASRVAAFCDAFATRAGI